MTKQYQIFTQWSVAKADNYDELYTQVTSLVYTDPNVMQSNICSMYKITPASYRIFEIVNTDAGLQVVPTDYVKSTYEEAETFINETLMQQAS